MQISYTHVVNIVKFTLRDATSVTHKLAQAGNFFITVNYYYIHLVCSSRYTG